MGHVDLTWFCQPERKHYSSLPSSPLLLGGNRDTGRFGLEKTTRRSILEYKHPTSSQSQSTRIPLNPPDTPTRAQKKRWHVADVGTFSPFGSVGAFGIREECSSCQLAAALPAVLGAAAETRGAIRGAFCILSRSGVSVGGVADEKAGVFRRRAMAFASQALCVPREVTI